MKCTRCGADSSVLATREYLGVFLRRRRKCFNEHLFTTYEVHPGNLDRRTLTGTVRGVAAKALVWKRRMRVLASDAPTSQVALDLGVSEARVRQIRAKAQP